MPTVDTQKPVQVFLLELEDNGSPSKRRQYIRLPAPVDPYVLRIAIDGGAAAAKGAVLYTNYPLDGSDFARDKFHAKQLPKDLSKELYVDIPIKYAGAYAFYLEFDDDSVPLDQIHAPKSAPTTPTGLTPTKSLRTGDTVPRGRSKTGYFNVDPVLMVKAKTAIRDGRSKVDLSAEKKFLPLDGLVIESVISKWLGPMSEWDKHFALMQHSGYNMVHFTPIQQRGESNSPYSIYDQLLFSDDLFEKAPDSTEGRVQGVKDAVARLADSYGILSLTDVVWNHTANNSDWLQDHPEAGYNVENSPHLQAALELDVALAIFSANLSKMGYPTMLKSVTDLDKIIDGVKSHVLGGIRLWEFYVIDVEQQGKVFSEAWMSDKLQQNPFERIDLQEAERHGLLGNFLSKQGLKGNDRFGQRHRKTINSRTAVAFMSRLTGKYPGDDVTAVRKKYEKVLDQINVQFYKNYDDDVRTIIQNIYNRVKYMRLDAHGPKLGEITAKQPLIEAYFTHVPENKRTSKHAKGALALANNGWIWNANPLQDFAGPDSHSYLRREVIVWGDCVKLRYGKGPEANPWLWKHMQEYTELLAGVFQGFRIDNCHSTPIHVGEYLLDAARRVRSDLYVVAELFTGSEDMDITFVSRLGINSLIREAMQAWDPKELSRLVHRHGGKPVGSMDSDCLTVRSRLTIDDRSRPCEIIPHQGSSPHALFMDCTHDNETPNQKRTPQDTLPTGALVAMSHCAVGSVKGFDEVFPELLDLVGETRYYDPNVGNDVGIVQMKRVLNHLHTEMAQEGYLEEHVHQENDYIIVHRVHPETHKGYVLVSHCAFSGGEDRGSISPIKLARTNVEYIAGGMLKVDTTFQEPDTKLFRGLKSTLEHLPAPHVESSSDGTVIYVPDHFPPGSIMVFATTMLNIGADLDAFILTGADDALKEVDLVDLNAILFRCEAEERDVTSGQDGTYTIPNYGSLVYSGLQGWVSVLRPIMTSNDLGHPLCSHLREGTWALDFVVHRIEKQSKLLPHLSKHGEWLRERFEAVKQVPNFMVPKYFSLIVNTAYKAAVSKATTLFNDFIQHGHPFTQSLALCSIQMYGLVNSTSLHPTEPGPSVAAGLPHFAHDYMRCWGRDVFISLRGLFLVTGNYDAARRHILGFASTLKHGMIPNLLDANRNPRYNSRDSPWWFCQAIQDYVQMAPNGAAILDAEVKRRFPLDDTWVAVDDPKCFSYSSTIKEIICEILQRHAAGLHFREWNAGVQLDSQMSDNGFNIDVEVDWSTGLIFGGSQSNCGTWMDKMGESEKAGTKGVPGTPRDGAAIEITGLLKSTLRWVASLATKGEFPATGVDIAHDGKMKHITYAEWSDLIQKSFERCYYIPQDREHDPNFDINPGVVNRRGIYKDLYRSGKEYEDYQLRPNFAVAMCVAPELFDPERALGALEIANEVIRGPLGMKTLDPSDLNYRGYYDNSNDSNDPSVAKGRNYHQGPEWVWCTGYFLRAYFNFDTLPSLGRGGNIANSIHRFQRLLLAHKVHIKESPWAGLPELTNADGDACYDSCPTQAWSASTLLDFLWDIREKAATENLH